MHNDFLSGPSRHSLAVDHCLKLNLPKPCGIMMREILEITKEVVGTQVLYSQWKRSCCANSINNGDRRFISFIEPHDLGKKFLSPLLGYQMLLDRNPF
jgi:hypothetical protein